jgi:predicted nuclease of restriction endonuclease-like (RecB) superfamily
MKKNDTLLSNEYRYFLHEAKTRIHAARLTAARVLNTELLSLYWDLGQLIVEKQNANKWGDSIVRQLAKDLTEELGTTRNFSARNLWLMRQMYLEYTRIPSDSKVKQAVSLLSPVKMKHLVSQIPWGHNILILQKVKQPDARIYYLKAAAKLCWSRNVLLNQVKADVYKRVVLEKKSNNFHAVLPELYADQAEEVLKSAYNLEFLGIQQIMREKDLEQRLIDRLKDFILELGYDFLFYRAPISLSAQYKRILYRPAVLPSIP